MSHQCEHAPKLPVKNFVVVVVDDVFHCFGFDRQFPIFDVDEATARHIASK